MTKLSDEGGPAFPMHDEYQFHSGMSLRDWFLGQALAGLCANPGGPYQANQINGWALTNCTTTNVAEECNRLVDAMLKARGTP